MGTCLSKKKGSSNSSPVAVTKSVSSAYVEASTQLKVYSNDSITASKTKLEPDPEVKLRKEKTVQEKRDPGQEGENHLKKEIFIIKHRKSHEDRERNSKSSPAQQNVPQPAVDGVDSNATSEAAELMGSKTVPTAASMAAGVRTSSCTKEEVDAILIQCGRLSRSSSRKAASGERGRKYSGSKRSYDFDHCDNDAISNDDDQKIDNSDLGEDEGVAADKRHHQHQQRHRQSPRPSSQGRRRTPSRERDQQQRSSSRERRVSRSPGRRSSDTSNPTNAGSTNASINSNGTTTMPGKLVSVPATVSSLADNGTVTGIKRISVKRNVGDNGTVGSRCAASPRSQSPSRANGTNTANAIVFNENQQQPSLSRNSSRKAEQSPYKRNPLSDIDPNSLAYPQSANNSSSRVQNRTKKDVETEDNQKPDTDVNDNNKNRTSSRVALEKGVRENCKTKEPQEEGVKGQSLMTGNVVVKTVVPSGVENLVPTLTRSRSSRRSRDLDINSEALLNPGQSYTSLLLEDIQNFHQKNTPSVSLPACVTKACSILEAVADLNSTTSSILSVASSEDRRSPPTCPSIRNEYNLSLGGNHYGKRFPDTKDPFVESEVDVNDDVMEPSLHKYVTVERGGSHGGVDTEDQESSGSNSFTVTGQQHWGLSSSSWEPNSADSTDCRTSRLNSREEGQKSPLGLERSLSNESGRDLDETRKRFNGKRRECNHQHSNGIGRGRLGAVNKVLHPIPIVAAAAST